MGIQKWDGTCGRAFTILKQMLTTTLILMPSSCDTPLRYHVDACQIAAGRKLTQTDDEGQERVFAYFSKKPSDAEADYTANERELLGFDYL